MVHTSSGPPEAFAVAVTPARALGDNELATLISAQVDSEARRWLSQRASGEIREKLSAETAKEVCYATVV